MGWRLTTMIKPTSNVTKKFVQFVASVTPHCHDITRLLSESMEHPLPLRTRLLIRLHFTDLHLVQAIRRTTEALAKMRLRIR